MFGDDDMSVTHPKAAAQNRAASRVVLEIAPRADHLFEEPGALEEVARLAKRWFLAHLTP